MEDAETKNLFLFLHMLVAKGIVVIGSKKRKKKAYCLCENKGGSKLYFKDLTVL